ncbi:hypothetical protein FisN_18Lh086 [Fistulifera solaris]|uniref:Peptidyl-prolyl cis-trans isomerase n=1 Tax=Fistulifera solaris TaxID=1519565 RepID=A0A1Z5KE28_FISSO|nr:hypothetical protein FisN_18Lh086 [Fistulifera solaris]|eukprot:GAX24533.1 hypothetical protein FisN_18Lh086 [Fistulifera solaris]
MRQPQLVLLLSWTLLLALFSSLPVSTTALSLWEPLQRIQRDYLALTRRVTARHILLPPNSDELCLILKQKIRNSDQYIVDAFEEAAQRYSRDETTNVRGGLIGELVPQGYCRSAQLDKACFEVRLGVVEGPIHTEFGTHLLLVSERTNCPKLDGTNTKLIRNSENNESTLIPSTQVGNADLSFVTGQIAFWFYAFLAGGILAEVVSRFV